MKMLRVWKKITFHIYNTKDEKESIFVGYFENDTEAIRFMVECESEGEQARIIAPYPHWTTEPRPNC